MPPATCTTCGTTNPDDARFCVSCGSPVAAAVPAAVANPAAPPALWAPQPGTGAFVPSEYASFGQRLGAWIVDGLIKLALFAAVWGAVAAVCWWADPSLGPWFDNDDPEPPASFYVAVFGGLALATLTTIAWDAAWSSSRGMGKPGQWLAGFRITTLDGRRISRGRSIGRACAKLVYSVASTFAMIGTAVTIAATDRHQSLHDMIAGTVCVRSEALERRGLGPGGSGDPVPTVQGIHLPPAQSPFI